MPHVQNPSIGAGAAALLVSTVVLTRAQILALSATPVDVVPAPGPGKLINVLGYAVVLLFGSVQYQCSSDILFAFYDNATQNQVQSNTISGVVTGAADANGYISGAVTGNAPNAPANTNAAIAFQANATYNVGPISTTTLGAGGLGYAANDTGTITTGNGDATYTVLTVGAGGAVLTYSITAPGTLYATGAGQATATGGAQPGIGVGFTVNVTAVATGNGTLKIVTYYQIIPVP